MDDAEAQQEAEMATDAARTAAEEADDTAEAAQRAVEIAEQARARRNLQARSPPQPAQAAGRDNTYPATRAARGRGRGGLQQIDDEMIKVRPDTSLQHVFMNVWSMMRIYISFRWVTLWA